MMAFGMLLAKLETQFKIPNTYTMEEKLMQFS